MKPNWILNYLGYVWQRPIITPQYLKASRSSMPVPEQLAGMGKLRLAEDGPEQSTGHIVINPVSVC